MRLIGSFAMQLLQPPKVTLTGATSAIANVGSLTAAMLNAPPFANSGTLASSSSTTSISPSLPFITTDYMLLAFCAVIGGGKTFSADAAWTMGDQAANGAACWAWRKVTAGGNTAPTFSWSGSVAAIAQIVSFGPNVKSAGAIGASGKASGSGTTISATAIVTGADNSRVVGCCFAQTGQIIPTSSGFTSHSQAGLAAGAIRLMSQAVPAAGASGSISAAISSAAWEAFLIEIERA